MTSDQAAAELAESSEQTLRSRRVPNPFATRFVRPGAVPFRFASNLASSGTTDSGTTDPNLSVLVDQLAIVRRGLIVGPHGSGKSTLLGQLELDLQRTFPAIEKLQLTQPSRRNWRTDRVHARHSHAAIVRRQMELAGGGLLIIDGIEQLSVLALARITRKARHQSQTILGTSHFPLRGFATLHSTRIDADLIVQLTRSLLTDSPPAIVQAVDRELQTRDLDTISNVRDFWFELYDVVQPLTCFPPPTSKTRSPWLSVCPSS